jgi:large repetitive protein
VVRRVDAISAVITTFSGKMGSTGYSGDGGPATSALLASPRGLALMPGGDLVITDSGNNAIRLVNIFSYQIQTIAGTGVAGYNQDGIAATLAQLNDPYGVAVRSDGAIAIADLENQRVRLVNPAGIISTAAGTGQRNAGTPEAEQLDGPADVAFDPAGDLFIADAGNDRVRVIFGNPSTIQTLVGTGSEQFGGDGGPANQASIYGPYALFFDGGGNLWLSDTFHNRVREISGSFLGFSYPTMKVGNVSSPQTGALYNQGNANLVLSAPVFNQAALDSATTTCNQAAMAPAAYCNMGVDFAPTQVGANIVGSIGWPSNAPNVTPLDDLAGEVLSVDVTSVALSASVNPGTVAQPVTLTATVTSDNQNRTGAVTFTEGSSTWCSTITLNSGGTAACVIPALSLGSHSFTAAYSGDANDAPSTSPAYTEIIKQQPALVLSVSPNPAVVAANVTLTLTAVDQSGTTTGNVVFYDGGTSIGTVALNTSGIAQWSTQSFSVSTHHLSAQYAGDSANLSGTSNTVSEHITQATTATSLGASSNNAAVGTPVILTATVTNGAGPALTGSVTFKDGTTVLGAAPLSSGSGSLTVSTFSPGSHSITAVYGGDTNDASSTSAILTETIEQIVTVTVLGTDANPVNAGATLHLTANVSLAPGSTADGALTGNVTFRDGSTVLGAISVNSGGQAVLAISILSVGLHSLVASYAGNTNYASSNSTAVSQTVQQTATQTTLGAGSLTTLAGKPATFSVSVSSSTGTPAGQVSFRDGSSVLGTVTLSGAGTATFSTSSLSLGTHSITVVYAGNSSYTGSVSSVEQCMVQLAQPTLTLSGPAGPVDVGTMASFTAALASPGVAPTGTMLLQNGGSNIATVNVSGTGSFAFAVSSLSIGNHTLTASYSGDANNSPATSASISLMVRHANSATTLMTSANPLTQGNPLTLTSNVTSDSPNPGGSIQFFDGTTLLGTTVLGVSGAASLSPTGLALGSHSLTAAYSGDTNHAASISSPITQLVLQSTSATLTSNNNPAVSGQNVIFTAHVSGAGSVIPTGTATFRDNGTPLAASMLNSQGTASFTTSVLAAGSHTITVSYAGDINDTASLSLPCIEIIKQQPSLLLHVSPNPAVAAVNVTLTLTAVDQSGTPTGTVVFYDGATALSTVALNSSGIAQWSMQAFNAGTHTLSAQYGGDATNVSGVSNTVSEQITRAGTVTTLATSAANPALGVPFIFTATVTNSGGPTLTGSVTWKDGTAIVGSAPLSNGFSSLTISTFTAGTHSITAAYSGDTNDVPSISPVVMETIQQAATQTTLGSASLTTLTGKPATFSVSVTSPAGIPTGQVSVRDGSTILGTAALSATGSATFSTSTLAHGTHSITAVYLGDSNYTGSTSAAEQVVVQPAQPTLTLSGPAGPVAAGTGANFTAALTSPGMAPTGTLLLLDGTSNIGAATISGAGSFAFSTSTLGLGTHTLTASYSGDANNSPAASAPITLLVQQASSSTTLITSANPLTEGNAMALTATVNSASPNAGGSIRFFDAANLLGTAALAANGAASFSPAGLGLGTHTLTAVYSGDTNHAGSTSMPISQLVVGSTTATLTSNNNPAANGQNVTFTTRIGGAGKVVPTGAATFRDNGTLLAVSTLDNLGGATFTTSTLAVGSHTITITYPGDQNFAAVAAQLAQAVIASNTQVGLTASANLVTFAQPVSLVATVTSNGGTATGTVHFMDAATQIGSAPVNASGVAVLTLSTLGPGVHTIVADYAGDGNADPSASTPLALSVKQTTALALSSNSNPALTLSPLTFTATLTNAGAAPATGTIYFTDAGAAIGAGPLDGTGHATLTLPAMGANKHAIVASYAGDSANFAATSAVYSQTVQLRATSTTLTNSATSSQQISLIAAVEGQGSLAPGGTVTFSGGGVTLGQTTIGANGFATVTVSVPQSAQLVTAGYSGDLNYAASQSPAISIAPAVAAPFTVSAAPPSITLVTHQHATIAVNIGSVKGFSDTIALGCLGLPSAGTCTFTPSQVSLSANSTATVSLVVDTGNPLGAGSGTSALLAQPGGRFLCCLPLGLLAGLLPGKRRRKLGMLLVFTIAIALAMGVSGCSGLSTNGTAPGTYTFKIVGTGQSSGISETQTVTLVVTQ